MKIKITYLDGKVVEAEGTKDELAEVLKLLECKLNHYPVTYPTWPYTYPAWPYPLSPQITWSVSDNTLNDGHTVTISTPNILSHTNKSD